MPNYTPITDTSVVFDTLAVNQQGFGTLLILDQHNFTLNRISYFASLQEAANIFPATSKAYKALQAAFSVNPKPRMVAVGKVKANTTLLPDSPVVGDIFSVSINTTSGPEVVSVTAPASPTVSGIGSALATAINANTHLQTIVSAASVGGLVTLTAVGSNVYAVTATTKLTVGQVPVNEVAADTMAAIMAESVDFTCIIETSRNQYYVQDLSAWVATTDYVMSYATSNSTSYSTEYSDTATDFPAILKRLGRPRNINCVYVQADQLDSFPDARIFAARSRSQPGDVIYSNMTNLGIDVAKNATGGLLTKADFARLDARGLGYFEYVNGVVTFRRGRSQGAGSAAWADNTMIELFTKARVNEAVQNRFFNTNTAKLAGRAGFIQIASVIEDVLSRMTSKQGISRAFQEGSVSVTIPTDDEIRDARPGRIAVFSITAKLEGAWDSADINITVSY